MGQTIYYRGCGWAPHGHPIEIWWAGHKVGSLPPSKSIFGAFSLEDLGNATVVGALRDSGATVASGSLTITGPSDLRPASKPTVSLHGDDEISFTHDVLGIVSARPGPVVTSYGQGASLIGWDGLDLG